jgi:hypothetical protein
LYIRGADLLIPIVKVSNNFAEMHNELWCDELRLRSITGEGTLKLELIGENKRGVQAEGARVQIRCSRFLSPPLASPVPRRQPSPLCTGSRFPRPVSAGWNDESVDYIGRTKSFKGDVITHYSGIGFMLCGAAGEPMSEEDKDKLLAKHPALGPLLNRLAHCQNAINTAGAGWKWDNPLGAYSLSLTKVGGLDMLNVYRQPFFIVGGKSLSFMQKAKCLSDLEGAYPSLPPKSVGAAVSAFNKAVFSIRMLLAAEGKPLWKAVGEAVKWFGDNGTEIKLSVKLNGTELNVDPLKAFVKAKTAEAKDAIADAKSAVEADVEMVEDAAAAVAAGEDSEPPAMSSSEALEWMKNPMAAMPSFEFSIESMLPQGASSLLAGNVDLSFDLTGPGASALASAPAAHKAVLNALVGNEDSVLTSVNSKLKKLALMLKSNGDYGGEADEMAMKGVTKGGAEGEERELAYKPETGAPVADEVKHGGKMIDGEFVRFGFGGSTKYTQSLVTIIEDLPARLEEATKLIENIVKEPKIYVDVTDPTKCRNPNYHALDLSRIPVTFTMYSKLVNTLPIAVERAVNSIMQALVYSILAFRDPATYALAPLDSGDTLVVAVPEDMGEAVEPATKGKGKVNSATKAGDAKEKTSWKIGLFCPCNAEGCGLCCCLKMYICGPCMWGSMMATGGEKIGAGSCTSECCCLCIPLPLISCICVHRKRVAISKAYGIKGGSCDLCKDCLCTCCSMIQLMNEVKVREEGAWGICGPAKRGGGPVSQKMER